MDSSPMIIAHADGRRRVEFDHEAEATYLVTPNKTQ